MPLRPPPLDLCGVERRPWARVPESTGAFSRRALMAAAADAILRSCPTANSGKLLPVDLPNLD